MSNLTTIQLFIFYTLIAVLALQVIIAILFLRSSVRYYIMISRKIIFRNIEFINGEIILIGKQADEEGIEKLISKSSKKDKSESSNTYQDNQESQLQKNRSAENGLLFQQDPDLLDFETYTSDVKERDVELEIKLEDLEVDEEIEAGVQDKAIAKSLRSQKDSLISITLESKSIALEAIERICQQVSASFLPKSMIHEITNTFDVELCGALEQKKFTEESILFYREIGIKMITSRFEEFLKATKQLKIELLESEKKKPDSNLEKTSYDETEDFFLDRISNLRKKSKRALLKTSKNLSFEIEFAVSA